MILLLVISVLSNLFQAIDERAHRAEVASRMIERAVTRTLESVEITLVSVGEQARADSADLTATHARIADGLRFAPHLRQIVVTQGERTLIDSSGRAPARLDRDRIGLERGGHASGGMSLGLRIGSATDGRYLPTIDAPAPSGGAAVLGVGWPVPESDGLTVFAGLNPGYFTAIFGDVQLGEHSRIGVRRLDGEPLLGEPSAAETPRDLMGGSDGALVAERGTLWPRSVIAFRLSSRYPVAVTVTLSHEDTVREWAHANSGMLWLLTGVSGSVMLAIALLLHDVARRIRLQKQVRLLFHAVEQSPAVVLITDSAGDTTYVNPAFTEAFGFTPAQILGRNPRLLSSGQTPAETYRSLWSRLNDGAPWRGEFINRSTRGDIIMMSAAVSAVKDRTGRVTHYVGIMEDITELKRIAEERERLIERLRQTNADLERFADVAAHHLQEPARRIATFAQCIRNSAWWRGAPEDEAIALDYIQQNSIQLGSLIRDIQIYLAADQPRGEVAPLDIAGLIDDVVARLHPQIEESGATITMGALPPAIIDRPRAFDLFSCVIENAIKYRRPGVPPVVSVTAEAVGEVVRYRVSDNGIGIAPAFRERVFGVFERLHASTAYAGTGVGLAVVRRVAESCGGRAWIEDSPAGGIAIIIEIVQAEAS